MDSGRISSAALMLSGLAGVVMPGRVAAALGMELGLGAAALLAGRNAVPART